MKCSFTICKNMRMSSRNTAMPESNILENRLFIVFKNMAGVLVSPVGITTHSYRLYLIKKVVFRISSSAIWHYKYPLGRLIDMEYFTLPI